MSATLGLGGDLERLMGRRRICRLSTPDGWDRQGVGRRFFIFPGMSLEVEKTTELRRQLMCQAKRSLVLVPSDRMRMKSPRMLKPISVLRPLGQRTSNTRRNRSFLPIKLQLSWQIGMTASTFPAKSAASCSLRGYQKLLTCKNVSS